MEDNNFHPDVISYEIVIQVLLLKEEKEKAVKLLREMISEGLLKGQNMDLLSEMLASGQYPTIVTYSILLGGLCKRRHLDEAIELLQKIVDKRICPDLYTYTILIDGLCKGVRLKTAQDIFNHLLIEGFQSDVRTYNAIINGLCKEGLFDVAIALLSEMDDNNCPPSDITDFIIIHALLMKNENKKAEMLLPEMISRGLFK